MELFQLVKQVLQLSTEYLQLSNYQMGTTKNMYVLTIK